MNRKPLAANIEIRRTSASERENLGGWIAFWLACAVAGFALPTAFAAWMGWLDPILK